MSVSVTVVPDGQVSLTFVGNSSQTLSLPSAPTTIQVTQASSGPPGADGATGTSFTWRGAWDNGTAYVANDLVFDGGSTWIAINANTGSKPSEASSDWDLFTLGADNVPRAKVIIVSGSITYIAEANPGSTEASAVWRVKKIDETDPNDVVITWADGNSEFDNVATNLPGLTYS